MKYIKKYLLYSLDLTTKNNTTGGFKKRHNEVTHHDLFKAVKAGLESIRRKAKLRKWQYIVYACISNTHLSKGNIKGSWHVHVVFYGSPCNAIAETLKSYWTKHGYGNSIQCQLKTCWSGGKINYVRAQEERSHFQKVNADEIFYSLHLKKETTKQGVLNALCSYE